jgi:hypothetical protein
MEGTQHMEEFKTVKDAQRMTETEAELADAAEAADLDRLVTAVENAERAREAAEAAEAADLERLVIAAETAEKAREAALERAEADAQMAAKAWHESVKSKMAARARKALATRLAAEDKRTQRACPGAEATRTRQTTAARENMRACHPARVNDGAGLRRPAETYPPDEPPPKKHSMLTRSLSDRSESKPDFRPAKPTMITRSLSAPTKPTLD